MPCLHYDENGGFFRLWATGPGVSWTCRPPRFSERHGLRVPFARTGKWRFFRLRSWKD